jgi:integrase
MSSPGTGFTDKQGQYLAFIDAYTRVHGRPPAEADLQRHFRVSPPAVHRMAPALERAGLPPTTPYDGRHTYASLLMAAGYTIKELMEFMGHADLQMVNRYVKLLPQPGEGDAAQRPGDCLRRATKS